MAINFPNSPTTGQLYTFNDTTWQWSGEYWNVYSAQTGYITTVSNAGNGFPVIDSVTSNELTLKSFSGTNMTITDSGGQLNFYVPLNGGGGGQLYYFNISETQTPYLELATSATTGAEQSITSAVTSGNTATIGQFLTPSGYPGVSILPGGVWSFYLHTYKQNSSANFDIYCDVYKRTSGGTETLLFSTDPVSVLSNSPTPIMVISDAYYSGATLNTSDRLLVNVMARNTSNNTYSITFLSEGAQHYSYVSSPLLLRTTDVYVNSFTYTPSANTVTIGQTENYPTQTITINSFSGLSITSGLTATTISATTYQNLPSQSGTGVSAFSYAPTTGILTITKNDTTTLTAGTFSYVTATTLSANVLSVTSNGGSTTTTTINATTGGTYAPSTGTVTLTGTGSLGTISLGTDFVTASTLSDNVISVTKNGGTSTTTTINAVTGGSYSSGTITLAGTGTLNTSITGLISTAVTAATLSENVLSVTSNGGSVTNTTINAVTGGSFSNGTLILSGSGSITNITGLSTTASTIYNSNDIITSDRTVNLSSYTLSFSSSTSADNLMLSGGSVGIGIATPTNKLTVSATAHPVKFIGLQNANDTSLLTVDGTGVVHTLSTSSIGGLTWNNATTSQTAAVSNGYVGTATTLTTITLPSTSDFGSIIEVVGTGTGLWRISQNAGQQIFFGIASTTIGTGGYLSATSQYDCVKLVCTVANTNFVVTSAIGNIFFNNT